ncbi:MAG: hypothetical protein MI810_20850 [Flavobacteriales bacterium]|nr:hypothetical protein [Flavobacteriales bacterium]
MQRILFLVLLLSSPLIFAQKERGLPLNVSYLGHFSYQPGIKLGTDFILNERIKEKERKGKTKNSAHAIVLQPQVAFFSSRGTHYSFLLNADIGYRISHLTPAGFYHGFNLGLGALYQSHLTSVSTNLGSGEQTGKQYDRRLYFMPTINYEFGQYYNRVGWFSRFSSGWKFNPNKESSAVIFTEFGLRIYLKK